MKSKTSFFNKTIFLKNITHFWPIWLLILLWNLFIMPFMIYNESLYYRFSDNLSAAEIASQKASDLLGIASVFSNPVVLFLFSIVAVMAVFSYLYNTRAANTMHAFPVTRGELFFTNYLSGLLFLIVPEIIAFLVGTLVSVVCGYTAINYLLTGLLYAMGISFVFYSFTVCVAMFTGQLFAVPIFSVILNFLYVGGKAMLNLLMASISYGITASFSSGKLDVLSPLYYLSRNVGIAYGNESGGAIGMKGGGMIAAYAVAAVIVLIVAYLIYCRRNLETAGSLISVSWIAPVFRWGVAFCFGALLSMVLCSFFEILSGRALFFMILLFALLFGGCSFFMAQMLLERGFRVFKKKRILECGVFVGIFACLLIAVECDLFGLEKKMPKEAEIDRAYINAYSVMGGEDDDLIAQILDIHSQIIDSKKEFEAHDSGNYSTYYIGIKYYLKDGSVLERSYQVPMSREIIEDVSSVVHKVVEMNAMPEVFAESLFHVSLESVQPMDGNLEFYDENGEWWQHEFKKEDAEKIYQAVVADIEAGNFKEYILNHYSYDEDGSYLYQPVVNLNYLSKEAIISPYMKYNGSNGYYTVEDASGYANIEIGQNCTNTIAALIEAGLVESEAELFAYQEDEEAITQ